MEDEGALIEAVRALSSETRKLHALLSENYPRRDEVERRFVSKYDQQTLVIRLLVGSFILTVLTFAGTIGSFSVCLVGDDNPGICNIVPGFEERIARRDMTDRVNEQQNREIERLLKKQGLNPSKPSAGGNG